jgi:CBS domain-containing protein
VVDLPVLLLEWSFYVLLLFGLVVAIGIFVRRGKAARASSSAACWTAPSARSMRSIRTSPSPSAAAHERIADRGHAGDENDRLVGIFTERDALTRVLGAGLEPSATKVAAVMTTNPTCVTPSTPLDEARAIITRQRIRHLPVVQDGKVLGMVSSGDLTHWLVRDQSSAIRDLVDTASR